MGNSKKDGRGRKVKNFVYKTIKTNIIMAEVIVITLKYKLILIQLTYL